MGYPPLPNPYRFSRKQLAEQKRNVRLSSASDETFDRWMALPWFDLRTIEEFAEDGGRPLNSGLHRSALDSPAHWAAEHLDRAPAITGRLRMSVPPDSEVILIR